MDYFLKCKYVRTYFTRFLKHEIYVQYNMVILLNASQINGKVIL